MPRAREAISAVCENASWPRPDFGWPRPVSERSFAFAFMVPFEEPVARDASRSREPGFGKRACRSRAPRGRARYTPGHRRWNVAPGDQPGLCPRIEGLDPE
jgi:hypothetical protein